MSKYRITLEGKTYEMEVELVSEDSVAYSDIKKEYKEFNNTKIDANVNVIDPSVQKPTINHNGMVTAPMPGTVIKLEKAEGDKVKEGDLVLILEAMKMENEIVAPVDGIITNMNCKVGGIVGGGEELFEVK